MLDNFGMGEFLVLAFFALLFFGPERLPQIGAQLGRWLSKLTGYSKAFMNQWSEEAAAVQGAVQDVMAIRDEIRSAQAEIAQTLNAAQKDIKDTISEARETVQAATPTAAGFVAAAGADGAPALASAEDANRFEARKSAAQGGDDSQALSKTQDVVNALLEKQGIAPLPKESPSESTVDEDAADSLAAAPVADADASDAVETDQDSEYQRNRQAIQELVARSKKPKPKPSDQTATENQPDEPAQAEDEPQAAVTQPKQTALGPIAATQQAQNELKPKKEEVESAFDKTQRILNQLMGIEPEPEPEPDEPPESALQAPPQQAEAPGDGSTETEREPEPAAPLQAPVAQALHDVDAVQQARSPENGITKSEFTKLSIEVTLLQQELRALRQELQTLRTAAPAQGGDSSSGMPVEEVA